MCECGRVQKKKEEEKERKCGVPLVVGRGYGSKSNTSLNQFR